MDASKHVPLAIATLAIVATLIGSTHVIERAIERALTRPSDHNYEAQADNIERLLNSMDARLTSIDENVLLVEEHGESPAQTHSRLEKQRRESKPH